MIRRATHKISKIWASIALLSLEMVIILVLFILALYTFIYLVRRVFVLKDNSFDQRVFDSLTPYVTDTTTSVMEFFTFLGEPDFLIPANLILIAYFLFIRKHRWYSIKIPAIALSSLALMFVLKNSFGRTRPLIPLMEEARGLSFPSGHALMSITFYGLIGYIVWHTVHNKPLKWTLFIFFLLLIFFIGLSRIYLRVHYTSDVIAGYCIGILWIVISIGVMQRIEKFSRRKIDHVVEKEAEGDLQENI